MTTDNTDLIKRLRATPPNVLKEREAADALQALQAERDAAQQRYLQVTDQTCRAEDRAEALEADRDALQARLASLEKQEPTAYLAWREGKPCWDGDDCVCEDAVYPVDSDDDRTSMPFYLAAGAAQPVSAGFDKWQKDPYTIVLQKSIVEDYEPKHSQPVSAAVYQEAYNTGYDDGRALLPRKEQP